MSRFVQNTGPGKDRGESITLLDKNSRYIVQDLMGWFWQDRSISRPAMSGTSTSGMFSGSLQMSKLIFEYAAVIVE